MRTLLIYISLLCPLLAGANGLYVSDLTLAGPQTLSFNISWQNSWDRDFFSAYPTNHDAVWLFVKVQDDNELWQHWDIDTDTSLHQVDSPLVVLPSTDGKGVFIRRNDSGQGDIASTTVTLKLSNPIPADAFGIKVFGMEMVWVETGAYYLGDSVSNFSLGSGDDNGPFIVSSENAISIGNTEGQLSDTLGDYPPEANIPADFPKGHDGFYCMRYEISQQQYVDFLNTLTYTQQQNRTANDPTSASGTQALSGFSTNRSGIVIDKPATSGSPASYACNANTNDPMNGPEDGQNRACNWISWADLAAYLDWAALRPMTEMEFEKTARGFDGAIPGAMAWGNNQVTDANNLVDDGTANEADVTTLTPNSGRASHGYDGPKGPIRCGFAATAQTGRIEAGAGFFGAMELSGNLWEMCVNTTTQGLTYTGALGDGSLDTDGNANTLNWPLNNGTGAGFKGGGWNSGVLATFNDLAISSRFYIYLAPSVRRNTSGGRGVR